MDDPSKNEKISGAEKPVPMPRRVKPTGTDSEPIYSNEEQPPVEPSVDGKTKPLRRISKSFQEKIRSHGFDKSLRRMIPKRKSVSDKHVLKDRSLDLKPASLPDDSIFSSISFHSPLGNQNPLTLVKNESDESSDNESFYTTSDLPPSYPPPPLPDESTYDAPSSVSSEGPYSYYSPGSDSNSIYEELTNYLSMGLELKNKQSTDRPSSTACNEATSGSRYEEIDDTPESEVPISAQTSQYAVEATYSTSSKTLMREFDPLCSQSNIVQFRDNAYSRLSLASNPFADPQVLAFFNDDSDGVYGNITKNHESILSDFENMNFEMPQASGPPPVPPRRYDSVPEPESNALDGGNQPEKGPQRRHSKLRSSIEFRVKQVAKYVTTNMESHTLARRQEKRGLLEKLAVEDNLLNEEAEDQRPLSFDDAFVPREVYHTGTIIRPGGVKRWGQLSQRKLTLFASKAGPEVKETIPIDSMLSLRIASSDKISLESEQVLCFELSLAGKSQPVLLGTLTSLDRHDWMKKLLECVTPAFPPKLLIDYDRAGWCYFKEGISSVWCLSSVMLSQRNLHLVPSNQGGALVTADLRMARCITLQEGDLSCKKATEKGPVLLLDVQKFTLYLQMDTQHETASWESVIRSAALNNGPALNQQQFTKDLVPIIVEKTINFVHTHGSVSEGIYRRSGSNMAVNKLLTALRKDGWAVQISRNEYSEYDVASVLKRFFRDLPEPLFVPELLNEFLIVVDDKTLRLEEKLVKYKLLLETLPAINRQTFRRLIGHLYFIDKMNAKNLMPVENLAAIWGPTLMHIQEGTSLNPNWSRLETIAVGDLITNYPYLFDVPNEEVQRELKILDVLENYHSSTNLHSANQKPSGDLKVWVFLNSHTDGDSVSVAVPPGKIAREMCDELSEKMGLPGHALSLYEVVSGGCLRRPLHHTECVLDTVLRWGNWAESDRRDNCLVLTAATLLQQLLPLISGSLLPLVDTFKFADARSKNFKSYLFELQTSDGQTTLCCYKDKSCSVKIHDWNIKDIAWFLGFETKRNPHTGWAITFFTSDSPPTRTKDRPFFGNTICGTTEQQKRKWMAALISARHPAGILPPPVLIE